MTNINKISNPRISHDTLPMIDLDVETEKYGVLPCTVCPADFTPYRYNGEETSNSDLYQRALNGEFGPIAALQSPNSI